MQLCKMGHENCVECFNAWYIFSNMTSECSPYCGDSLRFKYRWRVNQERKNKENMGRFAKVKKNV